MPRTPVRVRVVGTDLPGAEHQGRGHVHVGVQVKKDREVQQLVPGDADRAEFELRVDVARTEDGYDFFGPYAHGEKGARFLYLSWGYRAPGESFEMFRRAKLQLSTWDDELVEDALRNEKTIEGTLGLTDNCGAPLCAAVRPPVITWRAVERI